MRLLGTLANREQAARLAEYCVAREHIPCRIEPAAEGRWEIWVISEDHLLRARTAFDQYVREPDDPRYKVPAGSFTVTEDSAPAVTRRRPAVAPARTQPLFRPGAFGPLSHFLVLVCLLVAVASNLGQDASVLSHLFISGPTQNGLSEVRHGEIWRLLTPIFIHDGPIHLLFNMLWLADLGSLIERKQRSFTLLFLVLLIGVLSNLGQYYASGPGFGGMSGVVYGLLGYVWIRGKLQPTSGYLIAPQTMLMMVIWFFVCLFGMVKDVANAAHGVGLAVGVLWGYLMVRLPELRAQWLRQ